MGAEINNTKLILLSAVIFSSFFLAFLVVAVIIEPEETKKEESAVSVSGPLKLSEKTSGQIAGVTEGQTVVNLTTLDNSSNKT